MTTNEAWMYLESIWHSRFKLIDGIVYVQIGDYYVHCLCWSVRALRAIGKITDEQQTEMLAAIDKQPRLPGRNFCWPEDEQGAACRAKFCREQQGQTTIVLEDVG